MTWTGADSYDSVLSPTSVSNYVATLNSLFPDDYAFIVVTANNLTPNYTPAVQPLRHTADGIGLGSTGGPGTASICRYNLGGGTVIDGAYGVLDHEIGHSWGIFLQPYMSDANGHWFSNSTATGQMQLMGSDGAVGNSAGASTNVIHIAGDPISGFTWTATDGATWNETETFSGQDLYLQGFAATFPDLYVLTAPVYNPNRTVSYLSVKKYDQAFMQQTYGARNPSYQTSPKRIRMGVIYVAATYAEVQAVYQPIERSISHFVNAEQIDTLNYKFQVPFLVDTKYRASVNALLKDLDGNSTPTLTLTGPAYVTSAAGTATIPFSAADSDGPPPTVSCVPVSATCTVTAGNILLTGLAPGSHFFTVKAQDAEGKKTFAHFVVDVQ